MQVYEDSYHCFSCGAHGDVIDLAAQLYGVDSREAIRITAELAGISEVSDTKEYANRARIARQKARERTNRIEKLKTVYYKLIAEYRRLEMNRERYAPRSPTETELHPLFRESLNRLAVIEDALQRCEWAIIDAERK
jgi:DNA primase